MRLTKFEVSSFSRSGDTSVIRDRITESHKERITDIATRFNIASFAYIGGQRHKNNRPIAASQYS